jgi:hypothetical protein
METEAKILRFCIPPGLSAEAKIVQRELVKRDLSPELFAASLRTVYVLERKWGLKWEDVFRALKELV